MILTLCFQVKEVHNWTTEQKNSMRKLFCYCLKEWPSLVHCLREAQGTLVYRATERSDYDWNSLAQFDLELVRLTDSDQMDVAIAKMAVKLQAAIEEYWPECQTQSYRDFLMEHSRRRESQTTSVTDQAR